MISIVAFDSSEAQNAQKMFSTYIPFCSNSLSSDNIGLIFSFKASMRCFLTVARILTQKIYVSIIRMNFQNNPRPGYDRRLFSSLKPFFCNNNSLSSLIIASINKFQLLKKHSTREIRNLFNEWEFL